MSGQTLAEHMHDAARAAVARHTREALAGSTLFGREHALTYALGWLEPLDTAPDAENVARARGAIAGLRDAGMLT